MNPTHQVLMLRHHPYCDWPWIFQVEQTQFHNTIKFYVGVFWKCMPKLGLQIGVLTGVTMRTKKQTDKMTDKSIIFFYVLLITLALNF